MVKETEKLNSYRKNNNYDKYFKGVGIDLGCGNDVLNREIFKDIVSVKPFDIKDGDAQICNTLEDDSFDFVYSSHCLEHMRDPCEALDNWIRICKSQGHLIVAVPDETYYEKNCWPSKFNSDHKWSFRIEKKSLLPKSINIFEFLKTKVDKIEILECRLILKNFDMNCFFKDQTLRDAICQIEFILKKL